MTDELEITATLFIAAPSERVWSEITKQHEPQSFYFDSVLRGELRSDAPFTYESEDGAYVFIRGTTREISERRWVQEFAFAHMKDAPTIVSWSIAETEGGTRVEIVHRGFFERTRTHKMTAGGWPSILRNLKSLLESGRLPLRTRFQYGMMRLLRPLIFKKSR